MFSFGVEAGWKACFAMAQWVPLQGRFVQMVEGCNNGIRRKWKEIFDESQRLFPKQFVVQVIYLSHPACVALQKMTKKKQKRKQKQKQSTFGPLEFPMNL